MKKIVKTVVCILICLSIPVFSGACSAPDDLPVSLPSENFTFAENDFIGVDGEQLKTDKGAGEKIILKGTNAGGYLAVEQWMCALKGSKATGYLDHKTTTEIFTGRFGPARTVELWEFYRAAFWTEDDFADCAEMGMNVIRLPFTYMSVDPDYHNVARVDGEKYNFSVLDDFVRGAEKYGIYTILDLHGAYGSQNGKDHSGEQIDQTTGVDFYSNEENMRKTVELWSAVAEHFEGDAAVAGYDILNEPGEFGGSTSKRHWNFFDRLYRAIREKDKDHVVIFESCWDGKNLPAPSAYGWENCAYSFHNYFSGENDDAENPQALLASMKEKIDGVQKLNFGVPCYMGEFNCYGSEASWRLTLALFAEKDWHWTSWTYKLNRLQPGLYPGWGIYYTAAEPVVPDTDSFDGIKAKWKNIGTDASDSASNMNFDSGTSMAELMAEYCGNSLNTVGNSAKSC